MDRFQKDVVGIIKAALLDEKYEISADFDIEKAVVLAKKHGVAVMLYYGLLNCNLDNSLPIMKQLFMLTMQNMAVSERQIYTIKCVFDAFDKCNIDYMPLKGTLLKDIYQKSEMRSMGDADILIKPEQYERIKPIMQELGFENMTESNHEYIWQNKAACIELHKRLIPSYNKDFYAYFGDGWRLAKIKSGCCYEMTDEDQMIYLFTHYAKHYRDAGVGIRHIVDLWVYRNKNTNLNEEYIKAELEKLQLYDFYSNTIRTLDCWFCDGESDSVTDFITNIIFNSGVYGTKEANILSEALKISKIYGVENVKNQKRIKLIFPRYESMCRKYVFLRKAPFLLPVMWFVRIFDILMFKRESIKVKRENIKMMSEDNVSAYQKSLNFVGLDFNFKE